MTPVDIALLSAEWKGSGDKCPICRGLRPLEGHMELRPENHAPGCEMDVALAERGFATQADRDRARARI